MSVSRGLATRWYGKRKPLVEGLGNLWRPRKLKEVMRDSLTLICAPSRLGQQTNDRTSDLHQLKLLRRRTESHIDQ
jgi:hypothetical protein